MKPEKFIFGICITDSDCNDIYYSVFFGHKDTWEETKDPKQSLIYQDKELKGLLESLEKKIKGDPYYSVEDEMWETETDPDEVPFLTLEVGYGDNIPEETVRENIKALGFEYCPGFSMDVENKILRAPKTWTFSPEFLKVLEIARKNSPFLIKNIENILPKLPESYYSPKKCSKKVSSIRVTYKDAWYPSERFTFTLLGEDRGRLKNDSGGYVSELWTGAHPNWVSKDLREALINEILKEYSND